MGLFTISLGTSYIKNVVEDKITENTVILPKDSINKLLDTINKSNKYIAVSESSKIEMNKRLKLSEKYLSVESEPIINIVGISQNIESDKPITIDLYFENSGGSSAKPLILYNALESHTVHYHKFILNESQKTVFPEFSKGEGRTLKFRSDEILTDKLYKLINEEKHFVYIYGRFVYYDLDNKKHAKDFCLIYDPKIKQMGDVKNFKLYYASPKK